MRLRLGFLYLAVVIDLASRRVVGWAMRDDLAAELALGALRMALAARRPAPGLLHHSDRGVQYACGAYRQLLEANGLGASMSRKGNCWDNAVAESFFATLEWELIARRDWHNPDEARRDIFAYIRNVVQSPPSALELRLSQPRAVRDPASQRGIIVRNPVSTKPGQDQGESLLFQFNSLNLLVSVFQKKL